jgi:hypothetical protein
MKATATDYELALYGLHEKITVARELGLKKILPARKLRGNII